MERKIVAVDFDGTLFENKYPDIGKPKWNVISLIRAFKNRGYIIILWTCRMGKFLKEAVDKCKEYNIPIDYVNENVPEAILKFGNDSRKIYADIYIDDKGLSI